MKVCKATAKEAGEKLATQVFICKDQALSAESNCTQKNPKTLSNLSNQEDVPLCQPHQSLLTLQEMQNSVSHG